MRENIWLEFMTYEPSASGHAIILPLFKAIRSFGCVKNLKDSAEHFCLQLGKGRKCLCIYEFLSVSRCSFTLVENWRVVSLVNVTGVTSCICKIIFIYKI